MSTKHPVSLALSTARAVAKSSAISHLQQGFQVVCVHPRPERMKQEAQKHSREMDAGAKIHLIFHRVFIYSTPGVPLEPAPAPKVPAFLPLFRNTKRFQGPGVSGQ